MPYPEFYSVNEHGIYPFVPLSTAAIRFQDLSDTVPNDLVLDCGFWLGASEAYDPGEDAVYLDTLSRAGSVLTLKFTSTTGASWSFTRTSGDPAGATQYVDASTGANAGSAFLVTGDLSILTEITDGSTELIYRRLTGGEFYMDAQVEPALVQAETGGTVLSVTVCNMAAVGEKVCEGCGSTPALDETVYVQTGGLQMTGELTVAPGYNAVVSIDATQEVLSLQPLYGAGEGVVCGDLPARYALDDPSTGERCGDLLYTINGIPPTKNGAFRLQGSTGMTVTADDVAGVLYVTGQIGNLFICGEDA